MKNKPSTIRKFIWDVVWEKIEERKKEVIRSGGPMPEDIDTFRSSDWIEGIIQYLEKKKP